MPWELKKFGPSEIFTERQSVRSDAAWMALAGRKWLSKMSKSTSRAVELTFYVATKNAQGFIYIPNARELNLPPGSQKSDGSGELYGISMFHQIHCLVSLNPNILVPSADGAQAAIRHVFWQLMDGKLDPVEFEASDGDTTSPNYVPHDHGLWHIKHCFNYVRHGLQCAGDTTIEIPTLFNGHTVFLGWNTTHQCRNYETVWDYTLRHS